jgi:site-specific DNA-cytosine methylase
MMIGFPPCTDLAVSGAAHFAKKRADGRQQRAIDFFMALANAPIKQICLENPVGIISTVWRKPDQIIQPWQYGHDASKKTCLWLKGLALLVSKPSDFVEPRIVCGKTRWANQTDSGQNKLGPSETRSADRARTYQGIARAMAEQWV